MTPLPSGFRHSGSIPTHEDCRRIVAGGRSSRMGQEKAFTMLAGRTLLEHVVGRLAPQVNEIVINANGDASRFSATGLMVIPDVSHDIATPLAGLRAALRFARHHAFDGVLTVPSDAPFFRPISPLACPPRTPTRRSLLLEDRFISSPACGRTSFWIGSKRRWTGSTWCASRTGPLSARQPSSAGRQNHMIRSSMSTRPRSLQRQGISRQSSTHEQGYRRRWVQECG
ncbi:MAG: NTP transferase domain-containing protein [Sphingomonadales bacterium]|nr:NTP transferase domain-containing protein [Sphingomonadales bacterium]